MSDGSSSPSNHGLQPLDRKAIWVLHSERTLKQHLVSKRASRACQHCRTRKIRCNFTEQGVPCSSCRYDHVKCIVPAKRRRVPCKAIAPASPNATRQNQTNHTLDIASKDALDSIQGQHVFPVQESHEQEVLNTEHVPHPIYQDYLDSANSFSSQFTIPTMLPFEVFPESNEFASVPTDIIFNLPPIDLPYFIKPLPEKIGPDEIDYLAKKCSLTLPNPMLREALLCAYVEYVHPFLPLLDLHDFFFAIDYQDGGLGIVSLILYQAVMFAGAAFVDLDYLHSSGYAGRKEARADLFQRARLLYDFDCEPDRFALVQAMLLLTYHYETPDDQKDTSHWIGLTTSIAYAIGLNKTQENYGMSTTPERLKLWKRVWWSLYMRDSLIALGMRRPSHIKPDDFDIPMLTVDDFEIAPLPDFVSCRLSNCSVATDVDIQRKLSLICIEKARLCILVSSVLSTQYCVDNNQRYMHNDRTTTTLLPKTPIEGNQVNHREEALQQWINHLPPEAKYNYTYTGSTPIDVNRATLHMIFFATLLILHRPLLFPPASSKSKPTTPHQSPISPTNPDPLLHSRRLVRRATVSITLIAQQLTTHQLLNHLPMTTITALLPSIITHLINTKSPIEDIRHSSLRGFRACIAVMNQLRLLYTAADYCVEFIEAAVVKVRVYVSAADVQDGVSGSPKAVLVGSIEGVVDAARRLDRQMIG